MIAVLLEIKVVAMICLVGIAFGIGWQLGKEIAKGISYRFKKPVTVTFHHDDGRVSKVKLSHEEAKGYEKVRLLWNEG